MRKFIFYLLFFISFTNLFGQKRIELEKRKYKTQQEIDYSTQLLLETEKNKKETLGKLNILNFQIERRSVLINNLSEEIDNLDSSTAEYLKILNSMNDDLEILKMEYIKILRYSEVRGGKGDLIMFFLASQSLSQAYQRFLYVKRYSSYRSLQMEMIKGTIDEIQRKKNQLENIKSQKSITLTQKEREAGALKGELITKGVLVKTLSSKERELRKLIKEKERIASELQEQIEAVLDEERKKMKTNVGFSLTPEEKLIAGDFLRNRGKLPWPTERGIITGKYGDQDHPLIKNAKIRNNGIDITTQSDSKVRAVFDGTVTKIVAILGANYTVIIRHGNYLTVYQNLVDVKIKTGEKVKSKQVIGIVNDGRNETSSILHLEIWQNFDRMNPQDWLAN
jgi:murein hydrolase activator